MKDRYDFSRGVRGKYLGKVEHRVIHTPDPSVWKHPSVRALAENGDPFDLIVETARTIVLKALDDQSLTLPIDPLKLAELRSIPEGIEEKHVGAASAGNRGVHRRMSTLPAVPLETGDDCG